jgi:hypothetical protein
MFPAELVSRCDADLLKHPGVGVHEKVQGDIKVFGDLLEGLLLRKVALGDQDL